MKKTWKRLCTGFLALATVVTALPTTPVHAESKQYWTESKERVGIVEKVMNDGSIGSTFNEGHLTVEGEDAYCIDINTDFKNGYKTRADASSRMSADQISNVALSLEVGTQYKLVGWQMLKEENAELLINGKRVESDYMFTADSETMKVEVAFTFDATSLDGKQLVTFEELYDLSNPDEPKKVTEHKDIEDKGQTITFKEKPEEPEKPETPPTPEKPNRPSDSPKTGDSTNVMAFIVMLLASAGGLAGTYLYKRRKMKKS